MQILQQNQERLLRRQPAEELCEVPEQLSLQLGAIAFRGGTLSITTDAEVRKEKSELRAATAGEHRESGRVELPQQRKQGIGEERIRDAGLDGIGATNRECPAVPGGAVGGSSSKTRLSNSAFTDDEHRASRALRRLIDRPGKERKLGAPPDEGRLIRACHAGLMYERDQEGQQQRRLNKL
jgi:hypothetical protein